VLWPPTVVYTSQNLLAVVPVDVSRGEVVAHVRICGKGPFTVLLDTGTAPSVIDLTVARQLGIMTKATGQAGSGGGTGKSQIYVANLPDLELNGYRLTGVNSLALDLSGLSRKFGQHLDGVLGDSVFDGRVVQFDYPGRVARFFRNDPQSSGVKLHFIHSGNEVHLKGVRVNQQAIVANLDTGSNADFQLTPRGIRRLHLGSVAARAKLKGDAGFNGNYQSRLGKLTSVDIGPYHQSSPDVTYWLPGTGHDDQEFDMNVGNAFWRAYVVTIDYVHHVVRLSKH